MAIEIFSIGSSSSGNSYIIRAGDTALLLDIGMTAKSIMNALEALDIDPEEVKAVLVTHEHSDHIKSVRAIGRKCRSAVFIASRGTISHTENFKYIEEDRIYPVRAGDKIIIGRGGAADPGCSGGEPSSEAADGYTDSGVHASDPYSDPYKDNVIITAFGLSHDASEPLSYSVEFEGEKLAVVTDTGVVTEEIYEAVRDAGILVLEANHDEDLLMFGEYPYPLKVRIKGDHGHLSNRNAGEFIARLLDLRGGKMLDLMLAHLSFHNNAPFYARSTVEDILKEKGYERGVHYTLSIAAKDGITGLDPGIDAVRRERNN